MPHSIKSFLLCEVIYKKVPHGGTNIIGPDHVRRLIRAYDICRL